MLILGVLRDGFVAWSSGVGFITRRLFIYFTKVERDRELLTSTLEEGFVLVKDENCTVPDMDIYLVD